MSSVWKEIIAASRLSNISESANIVYFGELLFMVLPLIASLKLSKLRSRLGMAKSFSNTVLAIRFVKALKRK
jgi:hypothetical protein